MFNDDEVYRLFKNSMYKRTREESKYAMLTEGPLSIRSYKFLEYHHSINTKITDADMLQIQIDNALDTGDKELFMKLTSRLQKF